VAQGKTWLSSAVAESIVEHTVIEGARAAEPELSVRETEVLHLLAQGMSNREIGERLYISERTVRYHLRNIYDKLGLRGRGEAIAWAVRKGFGEETAG
jgi:DNA-binding NarL/FixJ family response regulator